MGSVVASDVLIIYLFYIWSLIPCRYLKFLGYEVEYVRNFTDIDDKVIVCPHHSTVTL